MDGYGYRLGYFIGCAAKNHLGLLRWQWWSNSGGKYQSVSHTHRAIRAREKRKKKREKMHEKKLLEVLSQRSYADKQLRLSSLLISINFSVIQVVAIDCHPLLVNTNSVILLFRLVSVTKI